MAVLSLSFPEIGPLKAHKDRHDGDTRVTHLFSSCLVNMHTSVLLMEI